MFRPTVNGRSLSACFLATVALLFSSSAGAQIRGMYSPGSTLTGGGSLPDPGLSYSNQLWLGDATELKGPNGKPLPVQPFASLFIDNNTFEYVSRFKFLRAHLGFSVDKAFSNGRFSIRDPFVPGQPQNSGGTGLTNTYFVPLGLGWQFKYLDIQTSYGASAPTGRYTPRGSNNVSSGFWTSFLQTGATIALNKSKSTQISLFNVYAWNTTQQGTGVHPGQNDSLDYSVSHTFHLSKTSNFSLLAGFAGYGQWQTTNNSGQSPSRDSLKYRIDAAGFTVELSTPYKGFYAQTSLLWEYGARSTVQGHTMIFTAGFQF
jgi:hypothetical protein